ncbi:MAG: TIGR03557 family F420-dependent LLM class oxidoreductase [Nocardiopsaceae bacterium]|nr:TIGR03557 family F420-dependent LLM class oxidoreductase [Nocardiopsaceae bacterium]
MVRIGYTLSTEEHGPRELIAQAKQAEQAGFAALWISDHFHPWLDVQGHSPFVWSVIGAIGEVTSLPIATSITCPIMRIHPAIIAQAAATSGALARGGFALGVGTGEALNEHIFGDPWPPAAKRRAMLEEAVALMRELWDGGLVTRDGEFFTVENARLYTLPDRPPPVYVSAFGPKSAETAGRIGDGLVTMGPDPEVIKIFRESGGAGKPIQGGFKASVGDDAEEAAAYARERWPNDALPGEVGQLLPLPRHYQQLTDELITPERLRKMMPCGPDPEEHLAALRPYIEAGVDDVFVNQVGKRQDQFFEFYAEKILPQVARMG